MNRNFETHSILKPSDCKCDKSGGCPVCDGGLAYCTVCKGGEAELDDESCEERLARQAQRRRARSVIPTIKENPCGLHQRYTVTKNNGESVDRDAVYFVLRLDSGGRDWAHIGACRVAARAYVDQIRKEDSKHMQQVADELECLLDRLERETSKGGVSAACNLDVGDDAFERARCLHRVVRAMHDGHCPRCGWLGPSETFYVGAMYGRSALVQEGEHRCCYCGFTVTDSEAKKALDAFLPYLENSVRVFEEWRSKEHHGK